MEMEIIKRIWCKWRHKRWIMGTYHPEFYWVCHKCKRRWKPKPKRSLGIGVWFKIWKLKWGLIIKRIWEQ
jgi:hypothetical protein